ncbi:MAG: hypothetical protein HOO00_05815 [Rhodospirillaceae bacterium]|jgi:hypothetical protein|nr:hypothetical protein [Rhodospirillaceae bacterium]MBT5373926.1 hypothetical protein [Rhodospirillaceae bacterium]MBT5660196.1 hypothetical protein [Rhodospirillaceae bacterium]MBT5751457.1 hypothetical protein [Rhodospirillaceae bacterium]
MEKRIYAFKHELCMYFGPAVRFAVLIAGLMALVVAGFTNIAKAEGASSENLYQGLNSDGQLIVDTMKKKVPDIYALCTTGEGNVRNKVIAVTTYLASARKLNGEPWAAGDATTPYFQKYCEELAEAEIDKELAMP